jgi:hypothetical protein
VIAVSHEHDRYKSVLLHTDIERLAVTIVIGGVVDRAPYVQRLPEAGNGAAVVVLVSNRIQVQPRGVASHGRRNTERLHFLCSLASTVADDLLHVHRVSMLHRTVEQDHRTAALAALDQVDVHLDNGVGHELEQCDAGGAVLDWRNDRSGQTGTGLNGGIYRCAGGRARTHALSHRQCLACYHRGTRAYQVPLPPGAPRSQIGPVAQYIEAGSVHQPDNGYLLMSGHIL